MINKGGVLVQDYTGLPGKPVYRTYYRTRYRELPCQELTQSSVSGSALHTGSNFMF